MTPEELHQKLKTVNRGVCEYSLDKCAELIPSVNRILEYKEEHNAILLAHTYVAPEIIAGVADVVGDSYFLSDRALESQADEIIFSAVHFMAETAKILNPTKRVIHPNHDGGCSLADSITGEEVAQLRKKYPDHTFICYINTTAEVKAYCHLSVTSSNVYQIIEHIESDKIFFLPDRFMAENVRRYLKEKGVEKEVLTTDGSCYVHEQYAPEMIEYVKVKHPDSRIAVHPECPAEVLEHADYVGSTSGIYNFVRDSDHQSYMLVTECGLSSRIQVEMPEKTIVGTCHFCKFMQGNTLEVIEEALRDPQRRFDVDLDEEIRVKAKANIERMFEEVERIKTLAL